MMERYTVPALLLLSLFAITDAAMLRGKYLSNLFLNVISMHSRCVKWLMLMNRGATSHLMDFNSEVHLKV